MTSCITPSKTDSKNNEFYVACGNTVFKRFLHEFDNVNDAYLDYIKGIKDPILRHISLYFVQYYIDGYYYYRYSQNSQKDGACDYLKRWLQERKDLFTYGEKCPTKMTLWKDKVEPLWEKLEKDYSIQNHGVNSWCNNKYPLFLQTEYPQGLTPFN
ncbi:PIR protein, partial [Plasmodium vivax]